MVSGEPVNGEVEGKKQFITKICSQKNANNDLIPIRIYSTFLPSKFRILLINSFASKEELLNRALWNQNPIAILWGGEFLNPRSGPLTAHCSPLPIFNAQGHRRSWSSGTGHQHPSYSGRSDYSTGYGNSHRPLRGFLRRFH